MPSAERRSSSRQLYVIGDHREQASPYARAMGVAVRSRALERLDPAALDAHGRAAYTDLFARFAEKK